MTVLLVEDEILVRMFGFDLLTEGGFAVIEAASGHAAVIVLESRSDIGVLFTDINMPGSLDGLALARLTHERWPHIGLLIASGKVRPHPHEMPPNGCFISKPFLPAAVVNQIRRIVQQADPAPRL